MFDFETLKNLVEALENLTKISFSNVEIQIEIFLAIVSYTMKDYSRLKIVENLSCSKTYVFEKGNTWTLFENNKYTKFKSQMNLTLQHFIFF